MATFTENFNYLKDLVYGVTNERQNYLDRWIKDRSTEDDEDDRRSPAERERHWAGVTQKSRIYINSYNAPIINTDFSEQKVTVRPSGDLNIDRYQQALAQNPKLSPQSTKSASMKSLSKGEASQASMLKENLSPEKRADLEGLLAIRRACKFGIEDVFKRRSGAKVHYVLDGIDMTDVVSKRAFELYSGATGVPITTSELRFLFRNWKRFQDRTKLKFYRRYVECEAPWLADNLPGWAAYALHLIKKEKLGINEASIKKADDLTSRGNYKGVVELFHRVTPAT